MKLEVYGEAKSDNVARLRLNKMGRGAIDVEIVDSAGHEIQTIASFEPDGKLELWSGDFSKYGFTIQERDGDEYIAIRYD